MVTMEVKSLAVDTFVATAPPTQLQTTATARTPELPSTGAAAVISIPSYSRWFSMDAIHQCELRFLPEFFDLRSPSKNSTLYLYYRNSIVNKFRANPSRKLTFTEARKTLVGGVGSVRRVFDFLEAWGLINYLGTELKGSLKWDEKDGKSAGGDQPSGKLQESSFPSRRWCSGCKSLCSIACFVCDKNDLTLCSRCYVRGNYRSDFRRVEINDELKSEWTEKETLQLLEAVLHHGDDWKRVAESLGGRSERECVSRFIKFPCGEEFLRYSDVKEENEGSDLSSPSKRICLTPFGDASNPIMAQAAFLSALAGVEVSGASARAAVTAISGVNHITNKSIRQDAEAQLQTEEQDVENAILGVIDVQMKEILEKIIHFEEFELQMEKKRVRLQQMKSLLFGDQLSLLFRTSAAPKSGQGKDGLSSSSTH